MIHISGYDHVGTRVTDAVRSIAFYEKLGFRVVEELSNERVAEMVTGSGVRINLISNGVPRPGNRNILMDEPAKWPGHTHPAFIVEALAPLLERATREGVAITEGPNDWGRRITCFFRDPDGNVLEFNELTQGH